MWVGVDDVSDVDLWVESVHDTHEIFREIEQVLRDFPYLELSKGSRQLELLLRSYFSLAKETPDFRFDFSASHAFNTRSKEDSCFILLNDFPLELLQQLLEFGGASLQLPHQTNVAGALDIVDCF